MRRAFLFLLVLLPPSAVALACSSFGASGDETSPDGSAGPEASSEAAPVADSDTADRASPRDAGATTCNPNGKFVARRLDGTTLNTETNDERAPRLSQDEKTLYFQRGTGASTASLYVATRSRLDVPFDGPVALGFPDDGGSKFEPSVTADGQMLYFRAPRAGGGGGVGLWRSDLTNGHTFTFTLPEPLADSNQALNDYEPFVTATGAELYFTRQQANDVFRIFVARRTSGGQFAAASGLDELATASQNDTHAVPSANGLTLFFARQLAPGDDYDIWVSRRASTSDPFSEANADRLGELSTVATEAPGWLSPDGCRLYFERSQIGATFDLWVAERTP